MTRHQLVGSRADFAVASCSGLFAVASGDVLRSGLSKDYAVSEDTWSAEAQKGRFVPINIGDDVSIGVRLVLGELDENETDEVISRVVAPLHVKDGLVLCTAPDFLWGPENNCDWKNFASWTTVDVPDGDYVATVSGTVFAFERDLPLQEKVGELPAFWKKTRGDATPAPWLVAWHDAEADDDDEDAIEAFEDAADENMFVTFLVNLVPGHVAEPPATEWRGYVEQPVVPSRCPKGLEMAKPIQVEIQCGDSD